MAPPRQKVVAHVPAAGSVGCCHTPNAGAAFELGVRCGSRYRAGNGSCLKRAQCTKHRVRLVADCFWHQLEHIAFYGDLYFLGALKKYREPGRASFESQAPVDVRGVGLST